MSTADNPPQPPDQPPPYEPPPDQSAPRPPGGGAFLALGIIAGFVVLYLVYLALVFLAGPSWAAAFAPVILFLAVAIVLTVRPRTRMFGTGLLIGLGVWVLLGGALCIPLLIPQAGFA
jgi:hypothetical protein